MGLKTDWRTWSKYHEYTAERTQKKRQRAASLNEPTNYKEGGKGRGYMKIITINTTGERKITNKKDTSE
jgi:hypothetical protein